MSKKKMQIETIAIDPPARFVEYTDREGARQEKIHLCVLINDTDAVIRNARIQLLSICHEGKGFRHTTTPDDWTPIKWTGGGFVRDIYPKQMAQFDAFSIRKDCGGVYLHSQHDVVPRRPIINVQGLYKLTYGFCSDNFPPQDIVLGLELKTDSYIESFREIPDKNKKE